jgi:hypothetical protein
MPASGPASTRPTSTVRPAAPNPTRGRRPPIAAIAAIALGTPLLLGLADDDPRAPRGPGDFIVVAQNDLGMHCMQRDYEHFMVLPPFNTVHAWIIKREGSPQIVEELRVGESLQIYVPGNTRSADKTNWWRYAEPILGQQFAPDTGLTGNTMAGDFERGAGRRFEYTGMPITPLDDAGRNNPYQLATVEFKQNGVVAASTQTVVPVSWELRCDLCHGDPDPGLDADLDILRDHDRLHATELESNAPVFCASCHADPALGAPGQPGISMFSHAMHGAHADRLSDLPVTLATDCYACHPGQRAQCQRDVHLINAMNCEDCHGGMADVGNPARTPWVDEPRCGDCHTRPGFEFEPPGVLFRNATGHGGVACVVCHGSPHAITPTASAPDNVQMLRLQGHAGTLNTCTVCHTEVPSDPFPHRGDDD